MYFDTHVREGKRAELQERLLALLQPPYTQQVAAHSAAVLAAFDRDLRAATSAEAQAQGRGVSFVDAAVECRTVAEKTFAAAYRQHLLIPCGWGLAARPVKESGAGRDAGSIGMMQHGRRRTQDLAACISSMPVTP